MDAACSGHPARISQLLLHPHPGMKHPLGAVRIAAALSPSLSSLMERLKEQNSESHFSSTFLQNEEQHIVCVADESGVYSPVQGKTLACARQCCLFFSQNQE